MPVLVVGADTPIGSAIIDALADRDGELRAFVSDEATALGLRGRQVKVALGDVSDPSHIGGAALNCFSVVFVSTAAVDGRERSFADDAAHVMRGWIDAVREARPKRVIWVEIAATRGSGEALAGESVESAVVDGDSSPVADVARRVAELDDAAAL